MSPVVTASAAFDPMLLEMQHKAAGSLHQQARRQLIHSTVYEAHLHCLAVLHSCTEYHSVPDAEHHVLWYALFYALIPAHALLLILLWLILFKTVPELTCDIPHLVRDRPLSELRHSCGTAVTAGRTAVVALRDQPYEHVRLYLRCPSWCQDPHLSPCSWLVTGPYALWQHGCSSKLSLRAALLGTPAFTSAVQKPVEVSFAA
jgi:hypothetical protein